MKGKIDFNNTIKDYYSFIKIDNNEVWKIIKDFPNYAISNYGRVKRLNSKYKENKNKLVPVSFNGFGYYSATLHIGHKSFRKAVHRLVAEAFIDNPNPSEYNIINHKDENKFNNRYDNLEWCSIKQNVLYSNNHLKASEHRKTHIKMIDDKGNITNYNSIKECADANNLDVSSISKRINNKANCYKEYTFLVI
jgi:hypothetical protein